jgi:hypothetical protein
MRTLIATHRTRTLILLLCLVHAPACVHAPPTLSPAGVTAFNNTRVIKGLDLVRDTAIEANAQIPPLLSTATTRTIVTYHRSAVIVIHGTPNGWQATVLTGLDETVTHLTPAEKQLLAPYFTLVKVLIQEVSR